MNLPSHPSRFTLLTNLACLLGLGWLYGGDLADALRARSAEVAAFLALPPLPWPSVVLGATLAALGVGLWGLARGKGEGFKGYRLLPIVLVTALFVDLVLAEGQSPLRSEEVTALSLENLQTQAQALAREGRVPASPDVLRPVLDSMGQPPYLVRGVRARAWSLQVREGCSGPVVQAPGLEVGTFIYCVAPDREQAWVSLVALPAGERFGLPALFTEGGQPSFVVVRPVSPDEESPPPGPDFRGAPPAAPGAPPGGMETPDAGERVPAPTP